MGRDGVGGAKGECFPRRAGGDVGKGRERGEKENSVPVRGSCEGDSR